MTNSISRNIHNWSTSGKRADWIWFILLIWVMFSACSGEAPILESGTPTPTQPGLTSDVTLPPEVPDQAATMEAVGCGGGGLSGDWAYSPDFDYLVQDSDLIAKVEVPVQEQPVATDANYEQSPGAQDNYVRVPDLLQVFKGFSRRDHVVVGQELLEAYEPHLKDGMVLYLFLSKIEGPAAYEYNITGGPQGQFVVDDGTIYPVGPGYLSTTQRFCRVDEAVFVEQLTAAIPRVELTAEPSEGPAPLQVEFAAVATGGTEDSRDLYCRTVTWNFGEGYGQISTPDCESWKPGATVKRLYTAYHTYPQPGTYEATVIIGNLRAGGAVVVVR